jgi:hypothetical protein
MLGLGTTLVVAMPAQHEGARAEATKGSRDGRDGDSAPKFSYQRTAADAEVACMWD